MKSTPDQMRADVLALLRQLHLIEHMQDRKLIKEIEKRYGFKPY